MISSILFYILGALQGVLVTCLLFLSLENKITFSQFFISIVILTIVACFLAIKLVELDKGE